MTVYPAADDHHHVLGLRERKRARMLASIQHHALQLFRDQGYDATTVEQICEAAEVSPSTFYRHFPTKEAVVLTDEYDPVIIAAFAAQPTAATPIQALRGAIRSVFSTLSEADMAGIRERSRLMAEVPALRAALLDSMGQMMGMLAGVVAARVGRDPDDLEVRTVAGALLGAILSVLFHWIDHPDEDIFALMDAALAHLEAGMRFGAAPRVPDAP